MSLVTELQRRNVLRVGAAYLVVGWLLTEVLTTILPTLGAPDWVARAVILCFAFGFVPVVVLAWIYELTPGGIRKDVVPDGEDARRMVPVGKLDYLAIAGVLTGVVAAAIFAASQQAPDDAETAVSGISEKSVAVLPFVNMSKDADNEYFSDGLTETLLNMLAQIPDLKVAARTSSFAFKGKNINIREIARALQVSHVLEGSVQQAGSRVRVTAQLIRATDGYHVWSKNFDRDSDDIFGIQDEIALRVGQALSESLLGAADARLFAGAGTDDVDAYDLYLQALKQRATFSYGGLEAAEKLLKGALATDPNFLAAKTELASNYLHQLDTGLMHQDDAFAAVTATAEQVFVESPENVAARAILAYVRAVSSHSESALMAIPDAILELESLLAEDPQDYEVRLLLTKLLRGTQQTEKALQVQREALELDPYNARIHFQMGALYLELGQLENARASLQSSLEIEPSQPNAYLQLGVVALKLGDGVDYLQQCLKAMEVDPRDHEIPGLIAEFLYQLGLVEEANDFSNRVLAIAPTSATAYRIEMLRAISLQDEAAGVAVARRAIENNVEDRQFAYAGAVQYLLRTAIRNGSLAQETAYLEQQAPGILDIDATAVPVKFMHAQQVAFDAWYTMLPREELLRRVARIQEIAAFYGMDLLKEPDARVSVMALQGNVDDAVELALSEVFVRSVLTHPNWRERFSQAQYKEFVARPRVQSALQSWEAEENAVRERVKNYLLDLSAA
ncbi:MAG: tetratricopeptide repeat protein [Gammaproteobacteria bacterium]|nr:tetratricopeptide repeat protein [Gammaproteobacteria bacterium]